LEKQLFGDIAGSKEVNLESSLKGHYSFTSEDGFLEGIWTNCANLLALLVINSIMDKMIQFLNTNNGTFELNDGSEEM
jgi:hypothetical protein